MVSLKSVEKQLKRIHFSTNAWGKAETRELTNILLPDEEIYECVNGIYEGGFALLCATNIRLLLVDKKPFNYLTVEDLRFDMINEIDYSHRMLGARIGVSTGSKNLKFKSYNQPRLRKLIGHVQHCMAEAKQQQNQQAQTSQQHLEKINEQLQAYLLAQHEQQQSLRKQLQDSQLDKTDSAQPEPIKPSPQLSDYLFAQTLLKQYREQESTNQKNQPSNNVPAISHDQPSQSMSNPTQSLTQNDIQDSDIYTDGMQEIFGKRSMQPDDPQSTAAVQQQPASAASINPLEINALSIAYSKLPMALRNRRFGRPSLFHTRPITTASQPVVVQPAQRPAIAR